MRALALALAFLPFPMSGRLPSRLQQLFNSIIELDASDLEQLLDHVTQSQSGREHLPERYRNIREDRAIADSIRQVLAYVLRSGGQLKDFKDIWSTIATAVSGARAVALRRLPQLLPPGVRPSGL